MAIAVYCPVHRPLYQLHAIDPPQLRRHRRCVKLRSAAASGSDETEPNQDSAEVAPGKLDWRRFRANLIAAEKQQEQQQPADTAAASGSAGEASTSSAAPKDSEIWAHQISAPETGCFLLANPLGNMGTFENSVVLLLQHNNRVGTTGVLLGRKLREWPRDGPFAKVVAMKPDPMPWMHDGGPVSTNNLLILHGPPAMDNSREVVENVYYGGWMETFARLATLNLAASMEAAEPLPFLIFTGHCGWAARQLEHEESLGGWLVIAASPKCVQSLLQGVLLSREKGNLNEHQIRSLLLDLAGLPDRWASR